MFAKPIYGSVSALDQWDCLVPVLEALEYKENKRTKPAQIERDDTPPASPQRSSPPDLVRTPSRVKKQDELTTPLKSKAAIALLQSMSEEDVELSLLQEQQRKLQEGIEALEDVRDSPTKRKRSAVGAKFRDVILDLAAPTTAREPLAERSSNPEFHGALSSKLIQSPWLSSMIGRVEKVQQGCIYQLEGLTTLPDKIFDIEHITSREESGGFHFCPKDHPIFPLLKELVVNPTTGVFCAKFPDGKKGQKYSSFFPSWIVNKKGLLALLMSGKEIAKFNNRSLCFVPGKIPFYTETYNRDKAGIKIAKSSFPIFSFQDLSEDYGGKLGDIFEVDQEALIAGAIKMLRGLVSLSIDLSKMPSNPMLQEEWLLRQPCKIPDAQSPLRYVIPANQEKPARCVFEFGPVFERQMKVAKGLFVAIPISCFQKVTGFSAILRTMVKQ